MPVVVITETERLEWTDEQTETKMFYRRPTSAKQREIQAQHTENGVLDQNEYLESLIEWAVTGWEGPFVDDRGQPMAFEHGKTRGLPDAYKANFILALYLIDPISAEMGN
jgi:hypothetical protein